MYMSLHNIAITISSKGYGSTVSFANTDACVLELVTLYLHIFLVIIIAELLM